jgi:hypothetical protein
LTRIRLSSFPALRQAFAGYLHEDFIEEHGNPAAALDAFRADASPAEASRFRDESARFLEETAALDFAAVRELLSRLGCRWVPPSRDALVVLLHDGAGGAGRPRGAGRRKAK